MENPNDLQVLNSPQRGRFEIQVEGHTAELTYSLDNEAITLIHTTVPPELEGRGIGSRLAKAGLNYARQNGLKVIPLCSFVRSYLEKHPEYEDLIAKK